MPTNRPAIRISILGFLTIALIGLTIGSATTWIANSFAFSVETSGSTGNHQIEPVNHFHPVGGGDETEFRVTGLAAGGRVAFSSDRILGIQKIFTIGGDGVGLTCLMCPGSTDASGTGTTDTSTGITPAVSPDGTTIAFVRAGQIWLMNTDGSGQPANTNVTGSNPQWSYDGTKLVFHRNINASGAPNNEIFIVNRNGTGEVNITNNAGNDVFPSWGAPVANHPDGRISFRSSRTGDSEIFVISPITPSAPITNVTNNPAFDSGAKWSPDGTKLVFYSYRDAPNGEIYTLNPDTAAVARLTDDSLADSFPAWSPDGIKIVFMRHTTSTQDGNYELFTVAPIPSNPLIPPGNLTNHPSADLDPSWGAVTMVSNGKIAFEAFSSAVGVNQIYTIADEVGATPALCGAGETREGHRPAYSHDGTKLAFMRGGTIWVANADCSDPQVNTGAAGDAPTWSPDGTKIAFVRGSPFSDVWTMNIDGSSQTRRTNSAAQTNPAGSFSNGQPSWGSNDKIVFRGLSSKLVGGVSQSVGDIWTMEPAGTSFARLTDDPVNAYAPDWSSDATKILFISNRATNRGELYIMNATGAGQTRITNDASISNGNPAWSPDGTKIVHDDDFSRITRRDSLGTNAAVLTTGTFPDWQSTSTTIVAPGADLNVSLISLSTETPSVDRELSYSVRLRNLGPDTSVNTVLELRLPANTHLISEITGCTRAASSRNVFCTIGSMPTGTDRSYQVRVRPTAPGPITLRGDARSDSPDATPNDREVTRSLQVTDVARPSNDNIANAQPITGEHLIVNGSNVNATIERANDIIDASGELTHARSSASKSVWYLWQAPILPGTLKISTAGSTFDTLLDVREFTEAPLPVVAYNDDEIPLVTSALSFRYQPGAAYYIAVDGFKGTSGDIILKVDVTLFQDPGEYRVLQKITGFSPAATCSKASNLNDLLCRNQREPDTGILTLTIKGENFIPASEVLIDGQRPQGRLLDGTPFSGTTTVRSSTELEVRVPPDPPILVERIAAAGVVTTVDIDTGNAPSEVFRAVAGNTGLLKVLDLQNASIPPGGTRTVCGAKLFNKEGGETCMSMINFGPNTIEVSPTWFAALAYCNDVTNNIDSRLQCAENLTSGKSFAINPPVGAPLGSIQIAQTLLVPCCAPLPPGLAPQFLGTGGLPLVGQDGSTLIGQDGGTLVGQDGSTLVGQDGSTLVGQDGSTLVGQDGSTLVGQDGSTLRISAGSLIGADGSTRPDLFGLNWLSHNAPTGELPTRPPSPLSAGDIPAGSSGYVVLKGSGGSEPTVTYTADEVTGLAFLTVTMILDDTSSPKVTNIGNMVFTLGMNPAVIKFRSNAVTVNEDAGFAAVTVERTGDTSAAASFEYTTLQGLDVVSCSPTVSAGNSGEKCDFATTLGAVRFAANETSKDIRIPIVDDTYAEGSETFKLIIGNALGAAVELPSAATITITDNDTVNGPANPLDAMDAQFLVRQQYLDLLGREPSAAEMTAGTGPIVQCGADAVCRKTKTVDLSHTLFQQSQAASGYVFRLYRAAFGNEQPFPLPDPSNPNEAKKWVNYTAISRDLALLTDGQDLAQKQVELVNSFVLRRAFTKKYSPTTITDPAAFVDAVLATMRNDLGIELVSQRATLISAFNNAGNLMEGRAAVMHHLANASQTNPVNNTPFITAEEHRAFATMLYVGYLKRDGDLTGLNSLVTQLQGGSAQRGFVDQFISGQEYRRRFGPTADVSVTVSGRVLTPTGQALRNAVVTLIAQQGTRQTATTSSFGLFSFTNVPDGGNYTVTVGSKRYRFAPRIVQVNGNLALGDLVGLE